MSQTIAVTVDGVLRKTVNGASGPIEYGRFLYAGLTEVTRVALLTDEDADKTKFWLDTNGFTNHPYLIGRKDTDPEDDAAARMRQIQRLREAGCSVGALVDPDPVVIRAAYESGITGLLYLHPAYARPEFRPDFQEKVSPWGMLVNEVTRQQIMRDQDARRSVEVL